MSEIKLEDGKWYWVKHNKGDRVFPAKYKNDKTFNTCISDGHWFESELMTVIRPLEDPPKPPLEDGIYKMTTGVGVLHFVEIKNGQRVAVWLKYGEGSNHFKAYSEDEIGEKVCDN